MCDDLFDAIPQLSSELDNEINKKNLAPIEIKICELLESKVKPVEMSDLSDIIEPNENEKTNFFHQYL